MQKSIYQTICENITGGIIPPEFSLPEEDPDASIHWAPGAMDGVYMFHMQHGPLDAAGHRQMVKALISASVGNIPEAEFLFFELTKEHRAVAVVDELHDHIRNHQDRLDAGNLFHTGLQMSLYSAHIECVKIGLELLELFVTDDKSLRKIICQLGLYEEFSLFAIWNMLTWDNDSSYIFDLAKKVHGWGRIHAVEYLRPENRDIKHWLLTEGTVNDIENAYSALTCWQKSDAQTVLFGEPTPKEYKGLSVLIEALLDEGPVPGISEIENAEQILLRFLEIAPDYELSVSEYKAILSIQYWAEDGGEPIPSVAAACTELLQSPSCTAVVKEAVKEGRGLSLAEELHIPFHEDLMTCMDKDFDRFCYDLHYLMDDPDHVEKALALCRKKLPLAEMGGEPVKNPGSFTPGYAKYDQLHMIIQNLIDKPLMGTDFIAAGLRSPLSRNRIWALMDLKSWVQEKALPLADLSPELYEVVREMQPKEIEEDCQKIIDQLLSGQTQFDDDEENNDD